MQPLWNRYFKTTYQKASFEDVQFCIQHPTEFLLINTMLAGEQSCLIKGTLSSHQEETVMNDFIHQYDYTRQIVVYGKNTTDNTVEKKYDQLLRLGFSNVYIYCGGLFEWLLLQDIYGRNEFPTTSNVLDILKFKPAKSFGTLRLTYLK
jgi:hypothetical protein